MQTVAAVLPTMTAAEHVVRHLENLGIAESDIHLIAGNDANRHESYLGQTGVKTETAAEPENTGAAAASAASFGGGVGILAGLAALMIPGIGPIIAGGAMATVITGLGIGAAAGGLVGAFSHLGVSHEDAALYEEAVRRGSVVVTAKVTDPLAAEVARLMDDHGASDLHLDAARWREQGWEHPDPLNSNHVSHPMPEEEKTPPSAPGAAPSRTRSYPYTRF